MPGAGCHTHVIGHTPTALRGLSPMGQTVGIKWGASATGYEYFLLFPEIQEHIRSHKFLLIFHQSVVVGHQRPTCSNMEQMCLDFSSLGPLAAGELKILW